MKRIPRTSKVVGLLIMAIGFVIPWYVWGVEFVGDKVAISVFNSNLSNQAFGDPFAGGVNKIGVWQLIVPRSLVSDRPLIRGAYFEVQGTTATKVLEDIGVRWAIVPILALLLFILVLVLSAVRTQGMWLFKESLLPLLVGVSIMLLLLLWNPVPPEPLKGFEPTPSLGKYLTILGALLLAISGFVNLLVKRSLAHSIISQS